MILYDDSDDQPALAKSQGSLVVSLVLLPKQCWSRSLKTHSERVSPTGSNPAAVWCDRFALRCTAEQHATRQAMSHPRGIRASLTQSKRNATMPHLGIQNLHHVLFCMSFSVPWGLNHDSKSTVSLSISVKLIQTNIWTSQGKHLVCPPLWAEALLSLSLSWTALPIWNPQSPVKLAPNTRLVCCLVCVQLGSLTAYMNM